MNCRNFDRKQPSSRVNVVLKETWACSWGKILEDIPLHLRLPGRKSTIMTSSRSIAMKRRNQQWTGRLNVTTRIIPKVYISTKMNHLEPKILSVLTVKKSTNWGEISDNHQYFRNRATRGFFSNKVIVQYSFSHDQERLMKNYVMYSNNEIKRFIIFQTTPWLLTVQVRQHWLLEQRQKSDGHHSWRCTAVAGHFTRNGSHR